MKRTGRVIAIVTCMIIVVMFGVIPVVQAQAPEDDVFAVIKISNPEALLPQIAQFVDQFQPGMGGIVNSMMVGNQVFKNPEWKGMDMAGEYTAVVLNPMKYAQNPVGIIVPLTNKNEYLSALSETLTGGEETDGLYTFMQPNQKSLLVGISGNAGVLTENAEVAAQVKSLIEANSPALSDVPTVKGQITASIRLGKILVAMQPMIDMFKGQFLAGMDQEVQGETEGAEGDQPSNTVKNIAESEVDTALALLKQTEQVQFGIGFEPEGVRLAKAVFPMADSTLAKFMAAQTPQTSQLMSVIPADSAIMMAGSLNFTPEFKEGYVGFLKAILGASEALDQATSDKLTTWAEGAFEAFGGDFAAGLLSPTSDSLMTEVVSVKDAAKARELVGQYPEILQMMSGMYEDMGFELSMKLADTTEVAGGEMMSYDFNFNADMIPDPEGQEVFTQLFGEKLSLPIGFTDKYVVAGFGKTGQSQVADVVKALGSGAKAAAKYSPEMFGFPEKNNMFMVLSVPKILSWAEANNLPDVPHFDAEEGPGLAMAARFVDSRLEGELYLPIEELLILKNISDQAQGMEQPSAE